MHDPSSNLRPGVYSRYRVTGSSAPAVSRRDCALILPGREEAVFELGSFAQAAEIFEDAALECLRLLFEGGVGRVYAACGATARSALALLEANGDIAAVVCDCRSDDDFAALKEHVVAASERMEERLGFCAAADPAQALEAAAALCCERIALCCPALTTQTAAQASPLWGACCLAARVLGLESPTQALSGEGFPLLKGAGALPEDTIQELLAAGICVFEEVGGQVELIRAMTTRTRRSGAPDDSLRSMNTLLIMDDVVRHIRGCLRGRLAGASSLGSVRDQVAVELAAKRDEGIISGFSAPVVRPSEGDPTVCLVDIGFSVAHLVDSIHITAHIRV